MINKLIEKLFFSSTYFTIAIKKREDNTGHFSKKFSPIFIKPATRDEWAADPMPVEYQGRTWLFYEAVTKDHGRIEVAEINPDCTLGEPTVILSDEWHYSYPFVFRINDVWYMIPESSSQNEVRLYEAIDFPYKWEQKQVLLEGRFVDSTIISYNNNWFLLSFLFNGKDESVIPKVFSVSINDKSKEELFSLKEIEWIHYDKLKVRGAGAAFSMNSELIRPSQISQLIKYGDGIRFNKIIINQDSYTEEPICEFDATDIKAKKIWYDGLHTYSCTNAYEIIDIRCREFDVWKILKRIMRYI